MGASGTSTSDEAAETGAKRKRRPHASATQVAVQPVHHVLQLPGKRAFNPWFLLLLRDMTASIEASIGEIHLQRSWFDFSGDREPEGDGHTGGWSLPTKAEVSACH